jgi:hypothetical protein
MRMRIGAPFRRCGAYGALGITGDPTLLTGQGTVFVKFFSERLAVRGDLPRCYKSVAQWTQVFVEAGRVFSVNRQRVRLPGIGLLTAADAWNNLPRLVGYQDLAEAAFNTFGLEA